MHTETLGHPALITVQPGRWGPAGRLLHTRLLREAASSSCGPGRGKPWALGSHLASRFPFVFFLNNLSLAPLFGLIVSSSVSFVFLSFSLFFPPPPHSLTLSPIHSPCLPPVSNLRLFLSLPFLLYVEGLPTKCLRASRPAACAPGVWVNAPASRNAQHKHTAMGGDARHLLYAPSCGDCFSTSCISQTIVFKATALDPCALLF